MVSDPARSARRRNHAHPTSTDTRIESSAAPGKHVVHHGRKFWWKLGSLLAVGFAFHLVYMLSIFDIYFRSPLVQGTKPIEPAADGPAKRLVLFVGDGCRADKAFEMMADGKPRMPFLHLKAQEDGAFGVCHTRVPTESRPGHIAMIAGFYEDVSAVTKGWKANPVNYDHVLARAKYAWSFGAPEIVDLFSGPNVHGQHYSAEMIDFASSDAKSLDQWSFDRLKELIEAATVDKDLAGRLKSDQVVIFVHLLGLDTNGHAFKPHSPEYLENVSFVDEGIQRTVSLLEQFYENDGKTAYIYTADHGMSDAGTHGDGDPDNTRTPIVAWGAGISGPQEKSLGLRDDHDEYSAGWGNLTNLRRRDINQADMTPLMASLIGVSVPVNSEGVLPVKLLGTSQEQKCLSLLDNARQIAASYSTKELERASREPFFRPFHLSAAQVHQQIGAIEAAIAGREYPDAQRMTFSLIKDALAGLSYLHKYDGALLKTICTLGYLGWIVYSLVFLARHYGGTTNTEPEKFSVPISTAFITIYTALSTLLLLKRAPLQFHLYASFATGFWHQSFQSRSTLLRLLSFPLSNIRQVPGIIAYVIGLELLVLTFFHRRVLALINVLLAVGLLVRFGRRNVALSGAWVAASVAMSAFPLLDPIKLASDTYFVSGAIAIIGVAITGYAVIRPGRPVSFLARLALIAMAGFLAKNTDHHLKCKCNGGGLSALNQNGAWILLIIATVSPFISSRRRHGLEGPMPRLLALFMTLSPAYILLSISYEPLFYACFAAQLALWIALESACGTSAGKQKPIPLSTDHLWLSFGFLFFVNLAFFGTGNVASISSFTLESVYRFITVFAPFPMAALLILKLLLPFSLLSAAFAVLSAHSGTEPFSLALLTVATTDIMTLNFFFLVRDHGSWLEIGTSISHFVIASSLIVFTLALVALSSFLMAGVNYNPKKLD